MTFNSLAPRVHAAFDLMGDGKTVIKGGYGRFNQLRELSPDLTNINRNVIATTTWDWHDNNGNKLYESGEVNLDPNGPDFRSIVARHDAGCRQPERETAQDRRVLADLRAGAGREHGRARDRGVCATTSTSYRLSEVSRDGRYTIPITNLDPGPDGRLGTGDDTGQAITYYEYPTSLGGAAFAKTMIVNDAAGFELQDLRNRGDQAALQ